MIALSRGVVMLFLACLALVGIPMALVTESTVVSRPEVWAPIVLVVELVFYVVMMIFATPRMPISTVVYLAVMMAVTRLVASGAAFIFGLVATESVGFFAVWAGNPLAVVLQIATLAFVAPHILAVQNPALLDREMLDKLGTPAPSPSTGRRASEATPAGGFIQVFGYEELGAVIKKTPGLEGFIIFSHEGLIVWRDLPLRVDADELTARFGYRLADLKSQVSDSGLARMRRVFIETREHLICMLDLDANFNILLLYHNRTTVADCESRIAVIAKTSQEFLQWKYPGLAVVVPGSARSAALSSTT